MGFKDGNVARVRWNSINRTKIQAVATAPNGGVQKRSPTKKNTPKKAKAGGDVTGDGDDEEVATPAKTPTKRGRKPKAEKAEQIKSDIKKEEMEGAIETTEKIEDDE